MGWSSFNCVSISIAQHYCRYGVAVFCFRIWGGITLLTIITLELSSVTLSEILRSESFTRWLVGA